MNELIVGELFKGILQISLKSLVTSGRTSVFCHTDVLRESVLELLNNVRRHIKRETSYVNDPEKPFESDSQGIPVEVVLSENDEHVLLSIKNAGMPIPSAARGRGLEMCSERLSPYGASVERDYDLQPPWVFGVKLLLLRG
jgi:signal transduction histidine kinase